MASLPTSIKYTIYDSFTSKRFRGNPAAVVLLSAPLEDTLYMEIAREFNLPMTAFVLPPDEPDAPHSDSISFRLRWITASMTEVIMCGHATLAAARYLFDQPELVSPNVNLINFATLSGNLTASRIEGDIELEFPSGELKEVDQELFGTAKTALSRAVKGVEVTYVGEGIGPSFAHMVVVVLKEDSALEGVEVDTAAFVSRSHPGEGQL
jgi:PhzF family phenazine biosynthesis protein